MKNIQNKSPQNNIFQDFADKIFLDRKKCRNLFHQQQNQKLIL